jgi:hypothetical protein
MIEMCPAGIRVSASLLQRVAGRINFMERSLWKRTGGDVSNAGDWEKTNPTWTRQNVLLPVKKFRGPVGTYGRAWYSIYQIRIRTAAARLLLIESLERHHCDGRHEPFNCFKPKCEARFEQLGEWTLHAIESGHYSSAIPPSSLKAFFDQQKVKLRHMRRQFFSGNTKMQIDWGEEGSEKRHNAEQAFLYQLDHDPLYAHGKPAKECSTWFMYTRQVNARGRQG